MDTRDRNAIQTKKSNPCLIITAVLILVLSIFIARSPLFSLNRPLKATFIKLSALPPFEGALAPNNLLTNAKRILQKKIQGPECIAFAKDGSMYTGSTNGQIVRIDPESETVTKIVQIGDEKDENLCNQHNPKRSGKPSCGAPLGLKFHPENEDMLYMTDAYYGIVKVDVKLGKKQIVLSSNDTRFKDLPMKFPDDLDIDGDVIYFIDSSYERDFNEAIEEHVEALPRGRLFSYDEKTDELEFLVGNLYFPNGMVLMPNKKEFLINEASMSRIIKFHLSGEKKGQKEIFAELPGYGDTIRLSDHGTLFVPFCSTRDPKEPSILDLFGEYPLVRSLLSMILDFHEVINFVKGYGLVAEYDLNGKLLKSWHDPTAKNVKSATNVMVHNKKMYIVSVFTNFIAVIDY